MADEEQRTLDKVIEDAADATRLTGRTWMRLWGDTNRVREIIEEGLRSIWANETDYFSTGGITIEKRDDGPIDVTVTIGTWWPEPREGEPEWT